MNICLLLVLCIQLQLLALSSPNVPPPRSPPASVYHAVFYNPETSKYTVNRTRDVKHSVCWGFYDDQIKTNGWSQLFLHTSSSFSPHQQMYAAGFLEGALTHKRIYQHYVNMYDALFKNQQFEGSDGGPGIPESVTKFFSDQSAWLHSMIGLHNFHRPGTDAVFWTHVTLLISQFNGLMAGYNTHCPDKHKLTPAALTLLNQWRDVLDVLYAHSPSVPKVLFDAVHLPRGISVAKVVESDLSVRVPQSDDGEPVVGEAIRKQLQDATPTREVLVGHVSLGGYWDMVRIFKHFRLGITHNATSVTDPSQLAIEYSMSSYPGMLASGDDFLMSRRGFVMMSSSLPILRRSLYQHIKPSESILSWMRSSIAARMESLRSAVHVLALFNSGTDNRQWMALDIVTSENQPPSAWILDMVPGDTRSTDVTSEFANRTFLFSANRPLSTHVARRIGLEHYRNRYGEEFSHDGESRAVMLQRELAAVQSLGDLKNVLRLNNFREDPAASGDPANAIAPRYDLKPSGMAWFGAIDAKITSSFLLSQGVCLAVSGPTTSGGLLSPMTFALQSTANPYAVRDLDDTIANHAADQPSHHGILEGMPLDFPWLSLAPSAPIRVATGFASSRDTHATTHAAETKAVESGPAERDQSDQSETAWDSVQAFPSS